MEQRLLLQNVHPRVLNRFLETFRRIFHSLWGVIPLSRQAKVNLKSEAIELLESITPDCTYHNQKF